MHLMTMLAAASDGQASALGTLGQWVIDFVDKVGMPGLWLLILGENILPVVPSEIVLPLAGLASSQGQMPLWLTILGTTIVSTLGALVVYELGRLFGHDRLIRWADKIPFLSAHEIERTTKWFHKHGEKAVFFGRMLPVFRVLISIPAGIERMHWWKFALLSMLGSGIWNAIFICAGFYLGEQWTVILGYAHILQWIVIAVVVILIVWWLVMKFRARGRDRRAADS